MSVQSHSITTLLSSSLQTEHVVLRSVSCSPDRSFPRSGEEEHSEVSEWMDTSSAFKSSSERHGGELTEDEEDLWTQDEISPEADPIVGIFHAGDEVV